MTYQLLEGDCLELLRTLDDNSVDAVCTDPPYGLEFMSVAWDLPLAIGPKAIPAHVTSGKILAVASMRAMQLKWRG